METLFLWLGSLAIALIAIHVSLSSAEELIQVVAALVAFTGLLFGLVLAPMLVKVFIIAFLISSPQFRLRFVLKSVKD